ncbi:MAG: TetR/AcrR family transcriptional regulator [Ramlibacter sp.]|nr:TetR/AcrR family transcriptional regulator [Ramlibacter sp.]
MEAKTRKSEMTRAAIIEAALGIARERGIGAISMRGVADLLQISKSGVFARSGSSEALQLAVVEEYGRRFLAGIFLPAMQKPRGLPRLDAIMLRWFELVASYASVGASIHEAAAFSLEPVDEELRQALVEGVFGWRSMMRRTIVQAMDEGHLRAGLDIDLLMYELHSLVLGALYDSAFLGDRKMSSRGAQAYGRLIGSYQP